MEVIEEEIASDAGLLFEPQDDADIIIETNQKADEHIPDDVATPAEIDQDPERLQDEEDAIGQATADYVDQLNEKEENYNFNNNESIEGGSDEDLRTQDRVMPELQETKLVFSSNDRELNSSNEVASESIKLPLAENPDYTETNISSSPKSSKKLALTPQSSAPDLLPDQCNDVTSYQPDSSPAVAHKISSAPFDKIERSIPEDVIISESPKKLDSFPHDNDQTTSPLKSSHVIQNEFLKRTPLKAEEADLSLEVGLSLIKEDQQAKSPLKEEIIHHVDSSIPQKLDTRSQAPVFSAPQGLEEKSIPPSTDLMQATTSIHDNILEQHADSNSFLQAKSHAYATPTRSFSIEFTPLKPLVAKSISPEPQSVTPKTDTQRNSKHMERLIAALGAKPTEKDKLVMANDLVKKMNNILQTVETDPGDITTIRNLIREFVESETYIDKGNNCLLICQATDNNEVQNELSTLKMQNIKQHTILETQSKQIEMLKQEIAHKDSVMRSVREKNLSTQSAISSFEEEKRNMSSLLIKKQEEYTQLFDDFSHLKSQVSSLKAELRESNEKLTNFQANELKSSSSNDSKEREIENLKKQNAWYNDEQMRKTEQFNIYRREKTEQLASLQNECEAMSLLKAAAETRAHSLQSRVDELELKIQKLIEKMREGELQMTYNEQQFKIEMSSQKKIAELYQSKSEELTSQNEELEKLIRDMEAQIMKQKEHIDKSGDDLKLKYARLLEFSDSQKLEIESLRGQLASNSDNRASVEFDTLSISKTAEAASKIHKAGQTFTEVYTEYAKIKQDLVKEKKESAELRETLDLIVKEVEHRKPFFDKMAKDLEKEKSKNDELSTQLLIVSKARRDAQIVAEQAKSELNLNHQDRLLLEKDIRDMSRQIQGLLKQMDSFAPGRILSKSEQELVKRYSTIDDSVGDEKDETEALISEKLVVFKNIEELQTQNLTLRRALRSVSQRMEIMEKEQSRTIDERHAADMKKAEEFISRIFFFTIRFR